MTSSPKDKFGIKCLEGSKFYVVDTNKPNRFIGCCRTDPRKREDGQCPDEDLDQMSFNPIATKATDIPAQRCVSQKDDKDLKWFACEDKGHFLGCCAEDACASGMCPSGSLRQAVLSDDMKSASAFIVPNKDTLAVAPTTSAAPSQPSVTLSAAKEEPSESSTGLPRAAVAGIGLGTAGLVLVLAVLIYWLVRKRRASKSRKALARTLLDGDAPRKLHSEKNDGIPSFHAPLTLPKDIQSSLQMPRESQHDSRPRRMTAYHSQTQSFAESDDTFVGSPASQYSSPVVPRYSLEKAPVAPAPMPPFMQNPAEMHSPSPPTSIIPGMMLPDGPLPQSTMQQSITQQTVTQPTAVPAFRQPASYTRPMIQQEPHLQQQPPAPPRSLENAPRPPHHLHPQNCMHPQGYSRLPPGGQPRGTQPNPQQQTFRNARLQHQKPLSPELPIVRRHSSLAFNPKALRFSPSGRLKSVVSERLEKHREAERQKEYEKLQASEQHSPGMAGPSSPYYSDLHSPRNMPMEGIIEDSESIMTYNSREPTHWEAVERR